MQYLDYNLKIMLSIKELQGLIELLNKKEQTLERIQEIFLSKFKDSQAVFRASYTLSNILSLNVHLLTSLQRIPAIFLLIENYKTEGISHHPFGATIFELAFSTVEAFQKKMIGDIIIDQRRQQYARFPVEMLFEKEQAMVDMIEDRPQLKALQQQFVLNLPEISQQDKSQIKNVIRDFISKEKQMQAPEHAVNVNSIKDSEISCESYNIGFMRPIPKFIDIQAAEYQWFGPTLSPETGWDPYAQMNRKLSKGKNLLRKAMDQHLTKDQCTEIQRALDSDPSAVLFMDLNTDMIGPMIRQNPFLVVTYLVKLSNYPIFDTYLKGFLDCEISLNSMEVVSKVMKTVKVPQEFVYEFTETIIVKLLDMGEENKDKQKLARVVMNFIKNFKKTKQLDLDEIQDILKRFLDEFIGVEEVQQFRKLMMKE